jgi:outer membrane lipoprotein SlyB
MGAATLISLVLSLLQSILAAAKVGGATPDVIANIEGAVSNLLAVQGTPVTFAQLEGLRVTTKW